MWIVKFRCEKGHEQTIKMPEETGEKGAKLFAALTVGGVRPGMRLSDLVPGASDMPPAPCCWTDDNARRVIGGAPCGAPTSWEVEHAPNIVTRGTRELKADRGDGSGST